jgi:uncharacterized Zn-binding protein involved in type VI secretion
MASKPITRLGDKTIGHGPYFPRASVEASSNVLVNNKGVHRVGDKWAPHNGKPNNSHAKDATHTTTAGSNSVFANNKAVARIGDPVDPDGDTIAEGSENVFAGDTGAYEFTPVVGRVVIEGRYVYDDTPAGIAALVKSETKISPNLPNFHEDVPGATSGPGGTAPPDGTGPGEQGAPPPPAVPPEGCVNSKYYKLVDSKMPIAAQNGLTKQQIECNWIALCVNILDKLRDAGFNFKINSAFRTLAYNRSIGSSNGSDHTIGCAVDITTGSQEGNKKLFKAILNKYPYSQLIFEGNWVHIAYNGKGPKGAAKVMYTYTGKAPIVAGATGGSLPGDLQA